MSNLERNWLIRTSQNQILGPVAKAKVVEFIQKGALGLTDEVSSGNGYWFHLREKDLVDKYLFGDVPQSYNPISEARTVLARKANPDQTTSINAAPANVTQVINLKDFDLNTTIPNKDDLEYPDITVVQKVDNKNESIKLPTNDDLEFPDVGLILSHTDDTALVTSSSSGNSKPKTNPKIEVANIALGEETKIPDQSDLEYPDMDFISDAKKKAEEEVEVKFEVNFESSPVTKKEVVKEKTAPELKLDVVKKSVEAPLGIETEPRLQKEAPKMLHERKSRAAKEGGSKTPDNKVPMPPRELAPELKNRNDSYLFIVLVVLVLLIIGIIFYYYRFILNKPLPV